MENRDDCVHDFTDVSKSTNDATELLLLETEGAELWFYDDKQEHQFLEEEHGRTGVRFIVATFIILVFGAFFAVSATEENLKRTTTSLAIVMGFAFTTSLSLMVVRSQALKHSDADKKDEATTEETYNHINLQHSTMSNPMSSASLNSIAISAPTTVEHQPPQGQPQMNRSQQLVPCARINEFVAAITFAIIQISVTIFYTAVQGTCIYYKHRDKGIENHEHCPLRVYPYWFFITSLFPLVISQPRFFMVAVINIVTAFTVVAAVQVHNTEVQGLVIILITCIAFLGFITVLKYVDEQQNRLRFQLQRTLELRRREALLRSGALKEFLLSITPTHLHSRLKNPSNMINVDVSEDAVCLVVYTRNVMKFAQASLPTKSAYALGVFRHAVEKLATKHKINHIRSMGDMMYLVCNLFRRDHINTQHAMLGCVKVATSIEPPAAESCELEVCCGAAVGSMLGMPLGSTCIRYDMFGPALRDAQALALTCPPGPVVNISSKMGSLMSSQLQFQTASKGDDEGGRAMVESIVVRGILLEDSSSSGSSVLLPQLQSFNALECVAHDRQQAGVIKVTTMARQSVMDLETRASCGCCVKRFANEATEQAAATQRHQHFAKAFMISTAACALFACLVLLMGVIERSKASGQRFLVGTALLAVAIVVMVCVAADAFLRPAEGRSLRPWHRTVVLVMYLLCLVGSAIQKPSLAGEATVGLCFCFAASILFMGLSARSSLATETFLFAITYCCELFIQPQFTRAIAPLPLLLLVYLNAALVSNQLHMALFQKTVLAREALEEVHVHEKIRTAVQAAIVPPQFAAHIAPENLQCEEIRAWTADECVVVMINISSISELETGGDGDAETIQQLVDEQMMVVEKAVRTSPNGMLSIVSAFGGNVVIAGPFETAVKNPAVRAVEDALHIVGSLLGSGLRFTAGVTLEQAVHALVVSSFPRYELMGPCVNTARLLVSAAPAEMVVVTEKVANLYQRECSGSSDEIHIVNQEKWRLRDAGVLAVFHVKATAN